VASVPFIRKLRRLVAAESGEFVFTNPSKISGSRMVPVSFRWEAIRRPVRIS